MRTGIHTDENAQDHTHIELETGNPLTTGHSGDEKHTTFYTEAGTTFTVRSIAGTEASELSAVLACVSVLSISIAVVETSGIPAAKNFIVALLLGFSLLVLAKRALSDEERVWKEILFLFVAGSVLVVMDSALPILVALSIVLTVYYVWLWKTRAIWEPVAGFFPFSIGMVLHEAEVIPRWLVLPLFTALAVFGFIGFVRIHLEAFQYDSGRDRMGE